MVPASLTTTLSASASVVLVAEVPPSIIFNSVAVEATAVDPRTSCPSGTTTRAAPPSIRSSALASHCIYAEAASPKNFTSYPVSSTPTVSVASSCTAPSISTASRFVVPSMSILPDISNVAAASSPPIAKLPEEGLYVNPVSVSIP